MAAMAADPSYPLFPIASIVCSFLLLVLLFNGFVRQSWNLGVSVLCFWLFLVNLTTGVNTIIWADNSDLKLFVYCDIVTHIQVFASIVRPASSLVITRRLYKMVSLTSASVSDITKDCVDWYIDLALVMGLPALVTGVFYYIVQAARFEIISGFGCLPASNTDGVEIMLLRSWGVLLPLISVVFYAPRIIIQFFRHRKAVDYFLHSNGTISHSSYFRVLAVACFDIVLSLPLGILFIALNVGFQLSEGRPLPFYAGWATDHSDWSPPHVSYELVASAGTHAAWSLASFYINEWTPVVLGFVIFGFFGLTREARWSYVDTFWAGVGRLGWKHRPMRHPMLDISSGSSSEPRFGKMGPSTTFPVSDVSTIYDSEAAKNDDVLVAGPGAEDDKDQALRTETHDLDIPSVHETHPKRSARSVMVNSSASAGSAS